ncbi:MAG: hypothetical protein JSS66_07995 [Armatimonadetes bacterium]|nr:hypothetical protein [Armatimonadota bacterium]
MVSQRTIAVCCRNLEDAIEASETIGQAHPRLFLVSDYEWADQSWLGPRDALLPIKPGSGDFVSAAARHALLFAPAFVVVFLDTTNDGWDDVDWRALGDEAAKYGFASNDQHWAVTKQHAAESGFPGMTVAIERPAPGQSDVTDEAAAELLVDLVPMFEVYFDTDFGKKHAELRRCVEKHVTSRATDRPSVIFVSDGDGVAEARRKVKPTGKVVCARGGPEECEYFFGHRGNTVRIYPADLTDR